MNYSIKTKILLSVSILLGVFVFTNLFFIQNINAGNITGNSTTNSDGFPHNGTTTLSGTIGTIAGTTSNPKITGIDGGNLTISSGAHLQLNAYSVFVLNPGSKIVNQGGSIVSDQAGAKIVHGYLWAKDADNDGCFDLSTVKYNADKLNAENTWTDYAKYKRINVFTYTDPDDNSLGLPPGCIAAIFDFSLSLNPTTLTIGRSSSGSTAITASLSSGTTQVVNFSVSGLPTGVTANTLSSCLPPCSTTLTLTASASATLGASNVTITATSGSITKTIQLPLTVCQCSGTSGCCDGCNFKNSSYVCESPVQYRCVGICGGEVQNRFAWKYCSGISADCNGITGSYGAWTKLTTCQPLQICSTDSNGYQCNQDGVACCKCTNWVHNGTNKGPCSSYNNWCTRTCTPSNCGSVSMCVWYTDGCPYP